MPVFTLEDTPIKCFSCLPASAAQAGAILVHYFVLSQPQKLNLEDRTCNFQKIPGLGLWVKVWFKVASATETLTSSVGE